jgi:hypothetical protein
MCCQSWCPYFLCFVSFGDVYCVDDILGTLIRMAMRMCMSANHANYIYLKMSLCSRNMSMNLHESVD